MLGTCCVWNATRAERHSRRGLTARVKTLYSPLHFESPTSRAKTLLNRGTDRETRQRHQDTPTRAGSGCVRARRLGACLAGPWHARQCPGFVRPGQLLLAGSGGGPGASGRGQRVDAHPPRSVRRGPDSERIRAFFISDFNRPAHRRRPAIDGSHHRQRWTLFNNLLRGDLGTGRWMASQTLRM